MTAVRLALPPPRAHVILEGGYYTIRPHPWLDDHLGELRCYYFEVTSGSPTYPFEIARAPVDGDPDRAWVVLKIPAAESVPVPRDLPSRHVMTFDAPTRSEMESFHAAVAYASSCEANGCQVSLALVVGDLALPREIRGDMRWALPREYETTLSAVGSAIILTESRCRAVAAKRIVRTARKLLKDEAALEQLYALTGASIVHEPGASGRAMYVAADALLDSRMTLNPIIALTKDSSRPACAATIAGKFRALVGGSRELVYHIAWYDTADDPDIRNKNIEGAIVAACFFRDLDLDLQIVTSAEGQLLHVDHLRTAKIRTSGVRPSYRELLRATDREGRHYGIDFVLSGASADCCVYHKSGAAKTEWQPEHA